MPKGIVGATGRVSGAHDARRALCNLGDQARVDLGRQVGTVLLSRPDRHDDDGITFGQLGELGGLVARPFDFAQRVLHHSVGSGAIGAFSHFLCSLSSSPFIVLKKMKLLSHCSSVNSPIFTPMWAGFLRITNLRSNSCQLCLKGAKLQPERPISLDDTLSSISLLAVHNSGRGRR